MEDAPWELVELFLCEQFHCLPSQLANEDAETISFMLELLNVRRQVDKFKAKPATQAGGKILTLGTG